MREQDACPGCVSLGYGPDHGVTRYASCCLSPLSLVGSLKTNGGDSGAAMAEVMFRYRVR